MSQKVLWGCIFLFLFAGVNELVSYIRDESLLSVMGHTILNRTSESGKKRLEKEKSIRILEGNRRKQSRLYRLDMLLLQSGIKKNIPFLNTEMFLLCLLCAMILSETVCFVWKKSALWMILLPVLIFAGSFALLHLLSGKNYKRAEEQLLPFMNLIGNYSYTEDDLVSIFGRIVPYLEEPYKSAVGECHLYAKSTGDTVTAFRELGMKIPHEQFQRLMRNLEICCQHEANYGEIIDDSREMLQDYLKNKKEQEALKKNARIEILLLIAGCVMALWMIDGMTERGIWELLRTTLPGKLMLLYCGGVLLACTKLYFSVD